MEPPDTPGGFIAAERYRADGMWIVFEDADRHEVYRLNERDVRSIHRDVA
jgi:hypothetical protein